MTNSSLPRLAAWAALASAPLAFACLVTALAAAGYEFDALADPASVVSAGSHGAAWIRASMLLDLFGYYLLLAPMIVVLDQELRRHDAGFATLLTACGFGYVLVGAIGASTLAAVGPALMRVFAQASAEERSTIALVFRTEFGAVHGGLWNLLEMVLGSVFWVGLGVVLRDTRPWFARTSLVLGLAAALDAVGGITGLGAVEELGLNLYLVLAPLWAVGFGVTAPGVLERGHREDRQRA